MRYTLKHQHMDIQIDAEFHEQPLRTFFDTFCISKKNRNRLFAEKQIECNHQVVANEETILHRGDVLTLHIPSEPLDFEPAETPCEVVYEDDFVYIAHKNRGQLVHGERNETSTLACGAAAYQQLHGIEAPVRYIHRLDVDTSGLVLFVKIPFFQPWFDQQLSEKNIVRHYMAITIGKCALNQAFTYNQPIGRDRHVNGKYRASETGKPASTRVRCLAKKKGYLLFGCELDTGRTHQIRVHLSENRHPIVNDPLYGVPSADFTGMGLWADEITFENPLTHQKSQVHDFQEPDFLYFQ